MAKQEDNWTNLFEQHVAADELDLAVDSLNKQKTSHRNTPPQAVKEKALEVIRKIHGSEPIRLFETGLALISKDEPTAKEVGICLLPPFYTAHSERVEEGFERVGDDANWEVREWAASALAHIVSSCFATIHPRLQRWTCHSSPNLRRMAAVAAGYAMRDITSEQCRDVLTLFDSLMPDNDSYVRKNPGPFALGSYAIRYHPAEVRAWATRLELDNERTATNLALMFTTGVAAQQLDDLNELLVPLVTDERKQVRSAVERAIGQLKKRDEQALIRVLDAWKSNQSLKAAEKRLRAIMGE